MESRVIYREHLDYIVYEDGRVFFPERKMEFVRFGHLIQTTRPARESKYQIMKNGYKKCALGLVHRLVAEAFIGLPKDNSYTVNHKDGNKLNNHYTNLEWISHSDNIKHWIYSDRGIGSKTHPIEVYDLKGNLVGVYDSKNSAAEELGLHKTSVTAAIKGRLKQTGGYTFKMITKEEYYAKTIREQK